MTEFYIYAEDLASALVGPFPSIEAADAHIKFLDARGDAAVTRVVTAEEASRLRPSIGIEMTAEEDRAFRL